MFKRTMLLTGVAALAGAMLPASARAQGSAQTVELVKVDTKALSAG